VSSASLLLGCILSKIEVMLYEVVKVHFCLCAPRCYLVALAYYRIFFAMCQYLFS